MTPTLALNIGYILSQWLWPILLFLLGLGLVVFVHELGHFLVAKFVGIKVERFAIGMGPRLVGIKKGETDYCLCALPLGGYVKMLGQEDFAPLEDGSEAQVDPRSFQAKSVGARMGVIAAGVVMNMICAALLFILVGIIGIDFAAPVVGGVAPSSPAATEEITWDEPLPPRTPDGQPRKTTRGLIPGDEVLALDDDEIDRASDLMVIPALADPDHVFTARIRRPFEGGKSRTGTMKLPLYKQASPSGSGAQIGSFGIEVADSLTFAEPQDLRTDAPFQAGQTITAMDGQPIEHTWQIRRWERDYFPTHPGKDVPAKVRFTAEDEEGNAKTGEVATHLYLDPRIVFLKSTGELLKLAPDGREDVEDKKIELTLSDGGKRTVEADDLLEPTEPQDILGMHPRVWVKGVMEDSPADEAGLEPGDVIYEYYDRVLPTMTQILEINEEVEEGGGIIVVIRDGQAQPPKQITPKQRGGRPLIGIAQLPDVEHAVIADLREGSPAAKAGFKRQDRILKVNDAEVTGWVDVFNAVRRAQMAEQPVVITVDRGAEQPETIKLGRISPEQFNPEYYRLDVTSRLLPQTPLMAPEVHLGPIEAIGWGVTEVGRLAARTYITLKGLLVGSVPTGEVSGPVGIGDMAIQVGRRSLVKFVWFIAMISVSLAVINFLPLPVVDGGHAVLLIIEKIRGRPVPVKVQNIIQIVGLVLLISLFLLITFQDITRLLGRMW